MGVVLHASDFFYIFVGEKVFSLSYSSTILKVPSVSDSFATPWTLAHHAPLSMGFFRQAYWSGLPFPSPGDLHDPRIEPMSPALAGRFFTTEPPGKPWGPENSSESTETRTGGINGEVHR